MAEDPKEYSEKEQWDDDLDIAPLNYVKPKIQKPILEKAEFDQKKKPFRMVILWISGIVFLTGLMFFIFRKRIFHKQTALSTQETKSTHDSSKNVFNENSDEAAIILIEDDPLLYEYIEDTSMIEDAQEAILNEMKIEIEEGPKNFHIVIGSFEQEQNAYSFVSEREILGENLTVIEHKGWYRVSHSTYFDRMEAEIVLDDLRNSLNILAWIAYMK